MWKSCSRQRRFLMIWSWLWSQVSVHKTILVKCCVRNSCVQPNEACFCLMVCVLCLGWCIEQLFVKMVVVFHDTAPFKANSLLVICPIWANVKWSKLFVCLSVMLCYERSHLWKQIGYLLLWCYTVVTFQGNIKFQRRFGRK